MMGKFCADTPIAELRQCRGRIFNIQFFCIHDGPGIRTTVFFKGCPLRCVWCHNPEGISREPVLAFSERKCVLCGACSVTCPGVHSIADGKHMINRDACRIFGACVAVCVTGALEIVGRDVSVREIVDDVLRDARYYAASGGGVTISGGEPAMQPEFLYALLRTLKNEGIHTCVETSGCCDWGALDAVLPFTDLFLYDIKETDPALHKKNTGADNTLILENLKKLRAAGGNILLRCPMVRGLNDRGDHFRAVAGISVNLGLDVEVLPYHKLAASKAGRMGLSPQSEFDEASAGVVHEWREKLRGYGARVVEM